MHFLLTVSCAASIDSHCILSPFIFPVNQLKLIYYTFHAEINQVNGALHSLHFWYMYASSVRHRPAFSVQRPASLPQSLYGEIHQNNRKCLTILSGIFHLFKVNLINEQARVYWPENWLYYIVYFIVILGSMFHCCASRTPHTYHALNCSLCFVLSSS